MITIAFCFLFLAFYVLYYTSKRAVLTYRFNFEIWISKNPKYGKTLGTLLLILAYLLSIFSTALGVGTLFFFITLMTIGSLIIILKPLKIIPVKIILFLFLTMEILEFYYL